MKQGTRTSLGDKLSLVFLAAGVVGLIALVLGGHTSPRLPVTAPSAIAEGIMPPAIPAPIPVATIHHAETRNAQLLQAAFDRIGFDLDSVAAGYISVPRVLLAALPPDIDRLEDADGRKILFLRALLPVVLRVNEEITAERAHLLAIRDKVDRGVALTAEDVQWVMSLADAYDQPDADLQSLAKKVDVIPPSLSLAQAIVESGWGTSRLARTQNSLFGQFGQGQSGDWDYREFASLTEAVRSYAHNLNTHHAYREFRVQRARMRAKDGEIDVQGLSATLHRYSERGDDYVQALRAIIRDNGLESFDEARLNSQTPTLILASYDNDESDRSDQPGHPLQ